MQLPKFLLISALIFGFVVSQNIEKAAHKEPEEETDEQEGESGSAY